MYPKFLTKQGGVAVKIANEALGLEVGSRFPNVNDLCSSLSVGAGTVQSAIRLLEDDGAICLQSRGHQGTIIEKIDRIKLWMIGDTHWISGAMPLPYTTRFEGLATALYKQFEKAAVPLNMVYVRGGRARTERLVSGGVHFAICSRACAILAQRDMKNIEVIMDFGPQTYMQRGGIVFADPEETQIHNGMKIGIDKYSYDHVYLNEVVCEDMDVEFVPVKYSELFSKLRSGEIDASYWNWDELQAKFSSLNIRPVTEDDGRDQLIEAAESAVLVTRSEEKSLGMLLKDIIDSESVRSIQRDVVLGSTVPSY